MTTDKTALDALLPCPFCGGEAEYWHGDVAYGNYALVCKKCECMLHLNNPFSYPEDCSDDEFDELNKKALAKLWNTRAALAPVDVDAGLRALDYQRDLALIFMVAKGSKDYDETIGDRIERVQELILQLKKQNDHLAARGCFGVLSREARLTIKGMAKQKLSDEMDREEYEYNDGCFEDAYDEMVKHARKLEAMIKAAPKKEGHDGLTI